MANPEHLAILKRGVEAWNLWREEHPGIRPDLEEALLGGLDIRGINLNRAILRNADLSRTTFNGANLNGADLNRAMLERANLITTNLIGADLRRAYIVGANLSKAELSGAFLDGAIVGHTIFGDCDLSATEGIEAVQHEGPSTIGIDTLFRSKGKISSVFLRGAGVPESLITYLPSLLGTGIEFYSLFISYSMADHEFVERLHSDLQSKGVRCWFAPHDMRSGKKIHEQIDEAIRVYDRLLLILSPSSMKSNWVETEISKARKREVRDKTRVLFPVRLCPFEMLRDWEIFDSDTGKDSAREIREFFIPDFSDWKEHDSYQRAFGELMRDLNRKG